MSRYLVAAIACERLFQEADLSAEGPLREIFLKTDGTASGIP